MIISDNRININTLTKGMYLLEIYTNVLSGKMIIIKE